MADWTALSVPCTSSRLLHLNSNELFAASTDSTEGIYKYNFIKNEWKLCMKYPEYDENNALRICQQFISSTFTLNSASNKLFLMKDYSSLNVVEIDTKTYNTQNHERKEPFCYHNSFGHWGIIYPSTINPNHHKILPILCDGKEFTHPKTRELAHKYYDIFCEEWFDYYGDGIVYIPSQNRLLACGGKLHCRGSWCSNGVWSCSLNTDNYKWDRIGNLPKIQKDLQPVITSDEEFIIMFGGVIRVNDWVGCEDGYGKDRIDDIYVLNLKTMKLGISEIVSPLKGNKRSGCIVTHKTKSRKLINGYCRNIIDISIDVMNIIS